MPDQDTLCPICEGSGLRIITAPDGSRAARPCSCRLQRRMARLLEACHIPPRYKDCSFDSFETQFPGATPSLGNAFRQARHFVESYPLETDGKGILFTGDVGVGKTNLAISTLRALVLERGATGLFVHYGDLLKQIQNSYNASVAATELDILQPVFDCDVLVIDELGAVRPSPWVLDTVGLLINQRYNDRKTTLVTTNYANEAEAARETFARMSDAQVAAARENLGDRIGERMRSRLLEMCVVVPMRGEDFRRTVNLARFG